MVETVSCIAAASDTCARSEVKLQDVTASDVEREQVSLFADMAERAIGKALQEPFGPGPVAERRFDLVGAAESTITDRKADLLASATRANDAGPAPAAPGTESLDQVAERVRTLYLELTEYQVAWKIGHKVQQDTSHILRGQ